MAFILTLVLAFAALNLWTFVLFGWDKMRAEQGGWRVSETSLLSLALIGGIGGAYAGRALFRHKTRKKSFNTALQSIGFFQLVALTFCGVYFYEPAGLSTPAYYSNCSDARSAGAAPLDSGNPGYRPALDRDNDGIACEPYRGR